VNTYFSIFLISVFASLILTPVVRRLCERFQLLDVPSDGRRVHKQAIPRLGGVVIFLSVGIGLSVLPFVDNLLTQSIRPHKPQILMLVIPATLVLLLGVFDDLRGTNAIVKFLCLGLIATVFYAMGGRIDVLAVPLFGAVHLPPIVSYFVTVLWLVGIANAFNLIDGMDGLATGAALFSSIAILVVSLGSDSALTIVVTLALSGALAGFLRYNFNPASIFLGDSGALFIGFTLAGVSVLGTQKATTAVAVITPILAFGLPVVDTGVTMARRLISGRPVFQGDSEHIHHMLLARGWSQRHVVLVLYAVCAIFGLLAMIFTKTSLPANGFVMFVIAVAVIVAVGHLRYHEVDEIKAGVKRNIGDRRIRVANNIRVRRSTLAISKAADLGELLAAVGQMLEFGEFVYAQARLGQAGQSENNERLVKSGKTAKRVEIRNGRIHWSWQRAAVDEDEIVGSGRYWSLRLPLATESGDWGWINLYRETNCEPLLVDMNYLCDLFRLEMARSVERLSQIEESRVQTAALGMSVSAG
jgi:UDP-GlcNAc:undecaprenyl-phosphate GlcNAc-1-phosphate transferase